MNHFGIEHLYLALPLVYVFLVFEQGCSHRRWAWAMRRVTGAGFVIPQGLTVPERWLWGGRSDDDFREAEAMAVGRQAQPVCVSCLGRSATVWEPLGPPHLLLLWKLA